MAAVLKQKSFEVALEPSARLFKQVEQLLSSSDKRTTPRLISVELGKSVRQLAKGVSLQEILVLRDVVKELSDQVERLVPHPDQAAAVLEDAGVAAVLTRASEGKSPVFTTAQSIRHGEQAMADARTSAATSLQERIRRKEFIPSAELQAAWNVQRAAISNALRSGRLFAVVGPSGEYYYPAFYKDESLDRRAVEKVSKALGTLPATSKYHFFTNQFTSLGTTPLEALRKGRVDDVIAAASSFAEQ
jgi:hypothetical protein